MDSLIPITSEQLPPNWWKVFEPKKNARGITALDGWCGMGVGTMSIIETCLRRGWYIKKITAVNHWATAIKVHTANYPQAAHFCDKMEKVDPKVAVPSGYLDVFTGGIKCQPFSRAAGGIERNDQERMDFYEVLRYATDLYIPTIVLENVEDFMKWGGLNQEGRPIKKLAGELFLHGIAMLRALNYKVEYRVLKACYYGDPTSRERLWIIAKKGNSRKVFFPEPTHRDPNRSADMFNATLPTWPVARDIIDWSLPTASIFGSKLVPNTLSRILAGADRFAGIRLEFTALPGCPSLPKKTKKKGARISPYAQSAWNLHYLNCALRLANGLTLDKKNIDLIKRVDPRAVKLVKKLQRITPKKMAEEAQYFIKLYGTSTTASLDEALPTTTTGNHIGMVLINKGGDDGYERNSPVDESMPTLTTHPSASLVDFIIPQQSDGEPRSVNRELSTIATDGALRKVEIDSFLIGTTGHQLDPQPIDNPLPTLLTRIGMTKVDVVLPPEGIFRGNSPRLADREIGTLTQRGGGSLVSYLVSGEHVSQNDGRDRIHSIDIEIPTLTTKPNWSVAAAFLSVFHGGRDGIHSMDEAMPTLDCANRLQAAYITTYYGNDKDGQSIDEALRTVKTRDSFMLVIPGRGLMDIRTRLLVLKELSRAHSIPDTFSFGNVSTEDAKKMVGNSWALKMGTAVIHAAVE